MFDFVKDFFTAMDSLPSKAEDLKDLPELEGNSFNWHYSNLNGNIKAKLTYLDEDGNVQSKDFSGNDANDVYRQATEFVRENNRAEINRMFENYEIENGLKTKAEEPEDKEPNDDDEYIDGLKVGQKYTDPNGFTYEYDPEMGSWVYLGESDEAETVQIATAKISDFVPLYMSEQTVEQKEETVKKAPKGIFGKDFKVDKEDMVNHPSHYTSGRFEVIDYIIQEYGWDFLPQNVIKYISRAGLKSDPNMTKDEKKLEDLQKALWYLDKYIDELTKPHYYEKDISVADYAEDKKLSWNLTDVLYSLYMANFESKEGNIRMEKEHLLKAKESLEGEINNVAQAIDDSKNEVSEDQVRFF